MIYTTSNLSPLVAWGKAAFAVKNRNAQALLDSAENVTTAACKHKTYKMMNDVFIKVPDELTTANVRISFKPSSKTDPAIYMYLTNTHRVASHAFNLAQIEESDFELLVEQAEEKKKRNEETKVINNVIVPPNTLYFIDPAFSSHLIATLQVAPNIVLALEPLTA